MTLRAVLLGLLWVVGQSAVIPYNEAVVRGTSLTGNHLPTCSMIALLGLVLVVNPLWRRLRPGHELKPSELAVIWILSTISANLPFRGFAGFLVAMLAAPRYYATAENGWRDLLLPHFGAGTVLASDRAARLFYEGSWGRPINYGPWIVPVTYWTLFGGFLWLGSIGLSVLFRRQWSEHEKFAFPLLTAPLELLAPPQRGRLLNPLLGNPVLWWGAALPLAVNLVNQAHALLPAVPEIPVSMPLSPMFATPPWIVIRQWPAPVFNIYFAIIGLAYLIPLEISFSVWFFFLLFKLESVVIAQSGHTINPWIAASRESAGAMLVIVIHMLWAARRHLALVGQRLLGRARGADDDEPLSYRAATLAAALGLCGCGALAIQAGADVWVAAAVLLLWAVVTFCLTWMVIGGGMFLVQAPFFLSDLLVMALGSRAVGIPSLVALRVPERVFMRDWGEMLMPHVLQNFKLGERIDLPRRGLVPLMLLSILVCLVVAIPASIHLGHSVGGINTLYGTVNFTHAGYNPLVNWARRPVPPKPIELHHVCGGAVFTALLLWLRDRCPGFTLHPIGFALGAGYANYHLWSSLLIGWLVKLLIIRGGRLRAYRRAQPFFLGLIVGDYLAAAVAVGIGLATGTGYRMLPLP